MIADGLIGVVGKNAQHRVVTECLRDSGLSLFSQTHLEKLARDSRTKTGSAVMLLVLCIAQCLTGLCGLLALSPAVLPLQNEHGQLLSRLRTVGLVLAKTIFMRKNIAAWTRARLTVLGLTGVIGMFVLPLVAVGTLHVSVWSKLLPKVMVWIVRELAWKTARVSRKHVPRIVSGKTGKTGRAAQFRVEMVPADASAKKVSRSLVACLVRARTLRMAFAMQAHVRLPANGVIGVTGSVLHHAGGAQSPAIDPSKLLPRMAELSVTAKARKRETACFKSIVLWTPVV